MHKGAYLCVGGWGSPFSLVFQRPLRVDQAEANTSNLKHNSPMPSTDYENWTIHFLKFLKKWMLIYELL